MIWIYLTTALYVTWSNSRPRPAKYTAQTDRVDDHGHGNHVILRLVSVVRVRSRGGGEGGTRIYVPRKTHIYVPRADPGFF